MKSKGIRVRPDRRIHRVFGVGMCVLLALLTAGILLPVESVAAADVSFAAKTNYSTGGSSWSVAVGDFNRDGKQDLVTANSTSNTVSVLIGNGDGSFRAPTVFAVGNWVSSVAVGDFNGDGRQDLVTANGWSNTVSVLLGDGNGGFGAKTDFATGALPVSVAVGDFNGDGKQDLAIANEQANSVSVLLGDGNGGFGAKTDFATDTWPYSIAVGDFNGDGKRDLALGYYDEASTVSVLLNDGSGGFAVKRDLPAGTYPCFVAVGDFNSDGRQDLVTANNWPSTVSVLLSNGDGSFAAKADFATGQYPGGIAVGDFNGDGKQDLVTTNSNLGGSASVLIGNGDGSFGANNDFSTGTAMSIAVGDFNGDGKQDLVTANNGGTVSVLLNNGDGAQGSAATISSVSPATGPTAGGTVVTIRGVNFAIGATVQFGANAATKVTVNSATSMTATSPSGSAGTVDVTVTTAAGTSAACSADRYAYYSGSPGAPLVPPPSSVTTPVKPVIVLIGGLFSDYGPNGGATGQTWHGTALDLRSRGYTVLIPPMRVDQPSWCVMDSMGDIGANVTRLDSWLADPAQHPEKNLTPGTQVVLVGHSMGGLIARGFTALGTKSTSQIDVVGIYQIDTPNLGSPLGILGYVKDFIPGVNALPEGRLDAIQDLAAAGPYIDLFNLFVAPKTLVPTRRVESDFFPDTASSQSQWWDLLQLGTINFLKGTFGDLPNDGLVSAASASYAPDGRADGSLLHPDGNDYGSLLVHAIHGKGIIGLAQLWPDAQTLPPERATVAGSAIFPDLAKFLAEVSAPDTTSTNGSSGTTTARSLSRSRLASTALNSGALTPTDLDSAGGWTTSAEDQIELSSSATTSVPFSVEAGGALISVSVDAGTPSISVVDSTGTPVACEATSASGQVSGAISCAPGQYVAQIGLSGADAAAASVSVRDAGPSELRVFAPGQAAAGSDFTVEAGVYENGVRQAGGVFTAAVGGDTAVLHDDGVAPDSAAGDGVFSGTLTAPASGTADITFAASGTDAEGAAVTRVAHALVSVAVPRAALSGPFTWHTTTGPSGKADALLFDVGVHASQDCTLRVAGTVTSGGGTVAQPSSVVTLTAGSDATVTLSVTSEELQTFDASGDFSLSSVELLDMTDDTLTSIDSATPDLSGTLAPADVEYAACSVGLEGSAPTSAATVELSGEAVCTTEAIGGVELSFDDGSTWYQAPPPDAGWGANDETWNCAVTLPEGDYGVVAQALDVNGDPLADAKGQCSFTVDRSAPTTTATLDPSGWSQQAKVTLAADDGVGSGVAQTLYSINGGPEQVYAGPFTVATEGAQVAFSSTDTAGNQEPPRTVSPKVDTTAPTTTDNAGSGWHAGPWSLALTPTDPLAADGSHAGMSGGSAGTQYSFDNGVSWQSGTSVAFPRWKRGGGSGIYTVLYRSTDAAGNTEQTKPTTVFIDNSLPTSSVALTTAGSPATVTMTASDPDSGVACVWYSLDGGAWQQAVYPGPAGVPLTIAGLGTHTLCYYAVDVAGNPQAGYRVATVTNTAGGPTLRPAVSPEVDTTAPTTAATGADADWRNTAVTVTLAPTDDAGGSGMTGGSAKTEYKLDAGDWTTGTSVTVAAPLNHSDDGAHTLSYRSTDAAGNTEAAKDVTVNIDTTPPTGDFTLADGAATTRTTAVSGDSSVTDARGPLEMRFSLDGEATWSSWEPYEPSTALTLPAGLGTKTVSVQYRDAAGNVCDLSDTITLIAPPDTTPPTVVASGVRQGAWYRGAVLVTLTASDSDSGVASVTYSVDGVQTVVLGALAVVDVPASPNRLHTLSYHATDTATNSGTDQMVAFTTDTHGPVTAGKTISGRKGKTISLRCRATDNLSPTVWAPRVVIKNARGKVVKTIKTSATTSRRSGAWFSVTWKPSARGTYRYYVYAKDLAGNVQSKVGSARVTVR
jgi:hypothetical protein